MKKPAPEKLPRDALDKVELATPGQSKPIEAMLSALDQAPAEDHLLILSDVAARVLVARTKHTDPGAIKTMAETYYTAILLTLIGIAPVIWTRWKKEGKDEQQDSTPQHGSSERSGSYFTRSAHSGVRVEQADLDTQAFAGSRSQGRDQDPDSN